MENKDEYHDPDYPEAPVVVKEEPKTLNDQEKVEKIKEIIRREFLNELEIRENEVMLIDQRMTTSRTLLHRLRYSLVNTYYKEQKLNLTNGQIQDEIAAQHEPRAKAEVSSILRDGQRRLHPSVRKLVGKKMVNLEEIFKIREPRNKSRINYSALVKSNRNTTISADLTKSLRPDIKSEPSVSCEEPCISRPKKMPRHLEPKITNIVTLDEVTRNKMKYRYRIVIGNTSKYVPAASRADRSTHKWLLYVRGAGDADISHVVTAVRVRLHHSYAPHHTVYIDSPPYHVCRRGWGEFPARVELQFALPERNRPASVEHTIKLDRNYTGLQTLGAETVVDVWLYSTEEMLKYQFKEDQENEIKDQLAVQVKIEPQPEVENTQHMETDINETQEDSWMEFFSKGPTEVDVDEMIIKPVKKKDEIVNIKKENDASDEQTNNLPEDLNITKHIIKSVTNWPTEILHDLPKEILTQPTSPMKRIVKYLDPTTGKVYYLEMDRNLDLSKVQEIVINNQTAKISPMKSNGLRSFRKKKGGVSLLKPEVKHMLKYTENNVRNLSNFAHIENDHCYLATPKMSDVASVVFKKEKSMYDCLYSNVSCLNTVRECVNYLVKKIPLISDQARDPDFVKYFPFVVESAEKYWKLDFAKRRNIEWSRAKLINKIMLEQLVTTEKIWRTKQILLYTRLHGYFPVRSETVTQKTDTHDWSSWYDPENHRQAESSIKELYPNPADINSLSIFNLEDNLQTNTMETINLSDDEDVDVIGMDVRTQVKKEIGTDNRELEVLLVENEDDRLRFMYIERKCADIGIELRNEDIGSGYCYSAAHAVLLSAMRSFAEELIRSARAVKIVQDNGTANTVWTGCGGGGGGRCGVSGGHVWRAAGAPRLRPVSRAHVAAPSTHRHRHQPL